MDINTASSSRRIGDIEALRAFAVIFTLLAHAHALFTWKSAALDFSDRYFSFRSGVDLFFAISGFVIARDLLPRLAGADRLSLWWRIIAFWIRRIYRIWPSSWLWLILILTGSIIFRSSHMFPSVQASTADFIASILQVQNFHIYLCIVNPAKAQCGDGTPWWSLSLEEQFYIGLPIAAVIFRHRLAYFIGALALIQLFLPRPPDTQILLNCLRTDALCLGVLLAIFSQHPSYQKFYQALRPSFMQYRMIAVLVTGLLLSLLATVPAEYVKIYIASFSTGLMAIISMVLVFIASFDRNYIMRGKFIRPVLMWVGSRSYAIYLIHLPVVTVTKSIWWAVSPPGTIFGPSYGLRYAVLSLALTAICAELNYRLIEQPLRRKGKQIAARFENGGFKPEAQHPRDQ